MPFYDLSKQERTDLVNVIRKDILQELESSQLKKTIAYFKDNDTYIRRSAYLSAGRIYFSGKDLQLKIINALDTLLLQDDFRIRQTGINAAGGIEKKNFEIVQHIFDKGLFDIHHSPRNAVIGSIKKMGEVNPAPILNWAKKYLHDPDKEIRREIWNRIAWTKISTGHFTFITGITI